MHFAHQGAACYNILNKADKGLEHRDWRRWFEVIRWRKAKTVDCAVLVAQAEAIEYLTKPRRHLRLAN